MSVTETGIHALVTNAGQVIGALRIQFTLPTFAGNKGVSDVPGRTSADRTLSTGAVVTWGALGVGSTGVWLA